MFMTIGDGTTLGCGMAGAGEALAGDGAGTTHGVGTAGDGEALVGATPVSMAGTARTGMVVDITATEDTPLTEAEGAIRTT